MATQTFHAQWAWRGAESAAANVRIGVSNGVITSVEDGVDAQAGDVRIAGVVIPGLVNAHSHAFHRALRGRTHGGTLRCTRLPIVSHQKLMANSQR